MGGAAPHVSVMNMTSNTKGEQLDYVAMANVLEQIAQELRQKASTQPIPGTLEQAVRLGRIAADIKGSVV